MGAAKVRMLDSISKPTKPVRMAKALSYSELFKSRSIFFVFTGVDLLARLKNPGFAFGHRHDRSPGMLSYANTPPDERSVILRIWRAGWRGRSTETERLDQST
jgi:hypothetical protein